MVYHLIALIAGFLLDLLLGDPYWMPHPIRLIGRFVSAIERVLYKEGVSASSMRWRGAALVIIVTGMSTACAVALIWVCSMVNVWLATAAESVICYQMLATKQLKVESMKVHDALVAGSLDQARTNVGMIVGRDTADLDESEVAQAAVETVAENASDGVIAPLLFMAVFGAAGGVFYKSVNTMDSMVGYKNDRYRHFGTVAARLDDVLNWIPARVSGVLMCLAAAPVRLDAAGAWRIFKRDRKKHASPNSAYTEAACAGALGVQLGGSHYYFGKLVEKPTIGDALRPICAQDIVRANRLLYMTAFFGLVLCSCIAWCVMLCAGVFA